MKKDRFKELVESIKEAGKIHRGEMKASREFVLDPETTRGVRLRSSSNDVEIINAYAAELNAEAEDVLSYQVIP
jgi:hypothetical protein